MFTLVYVTNVKKHVQFIILSFNTVHGEVTYNDLLFLLIFIKYLDDIKHVAIIFSQ